MHNKTHNNNTTTKDAFPGFFRRVLDLRRPEAAAKLAQHERTALVLFFTHVFSGLEDEMVRAADARRQFDLSLSIYQSGMSLMRTALGRRG